MRQMEGESARREGERLAAAGDADAAKWLAGAEGERRVAHALSGLPPGWTVIHDRLLMPGLTEWNLDHVLVGRPGVVLVDAKNFSGEITVWNESLFQHLGHGPDRTSRNLIGELRKVHWMAAEMGRRLGGPVIPVLCLAGNRQQRFGDPQLVCGVWVVPLRAVVEWLVGRGSRVTEEDARRLVPRVLSEFPSTMTDPELLAAIGRDLGKSAPVRTATPVRSSRVARESKAPRGARTPRRRASRRHSLWRWVRFALLTGLLVWGVQNLTTVSGRVGTFLSSALTAGASSQTPAVAAVSPSTGPEQGVGPEPGAFSCEALSAERLSTYVKVTVSAWHWDDGTCTWVTDPADPRSVILTAELLSARTVAHLPGEEVSLSASGSLDPPGPTSVLLAREGQWIPVADTRTVVRWPMRLEIHRGPLTVDDHRGQQILRAAAADLNAPAE